MQEEGEDSPSQVYYSGEPEADPELRKLVEGIFNIIPSYFDEREARQIADLIREYVRGKLEQRE